jgi:four helix bundle protein
VNDLEARTKAFALAVVKTVKAAGRNPVADVLHHQLLRSGTSVGAVYREARRAESRKDFIHKVGIAAKEASESSYWLELINESGFGTPGTIELHQESDELLRILSASGRTARRNTPLRK